MIHVQLPVTGWLESVSRLPAKTLVKAFSVQWLAEAKAANPAVYTLHRYVNDALQDVNPDDTDAVRENRARHWFSQFVDGTFLDGSTAGIPHWQATDMVSWWNEYYADSQDPVEKELWWRQERIAARIWREEYRQGPHAAKLGHIRLAIGAAAVGNNLPAQSAQTAVQYDCVLDYHAYDKYFDGGLRDPLSWQYHCGRWNTMDVAFRQAGYTCDWLFGEAGPYGSAVTGWRHETIFNGDVGRYVGAVRTWVKEIKLTHAYATGRVLGFALFTTADGAHWPYFQTRQPELNALADMMAQEWVAVTPPPPPPDPTPDPCQPRVPYQREYWAVPQDATPDQFATLARLAHTSRRTIGFSYDDALFGPNLTSRKAVLFGIPENQRQAFLSFRDQYYPGAVITFQDMPGPLFDWPIGTEAERQAATDGLPGNWIDANPYGNRYQFGTPLQWARHTGADLNLNLPVANSDANSPVLAIAPGVVLFASLVANSTWGRLVVLRHEVGGVVFHSRYAHLRTLTVGQGQVVATGQQLGTIGGIEYDVATHLHWDVSHSGVLQANPIHWPGDNLALVQQHYLPPIPFLVGKKA